MENEEMNLDVRLNELDRKVNNYRWLLKIAEDYERYISLIEKEKDYFRVTGIGFTARCDGRTFGINPHRSISYTYILDGLRDALERVNREIEECRKELEGMMV